MQIDVRVIGVNPHDLWIGRRHSLDRNAVVLLLIDQLNTKRNTVGGVYEVCCVIHQNWALPNKVTRGAKRLA